MNEDTQIAQFGAVDTLDLEAVPRHLWDRVLTLRRERQLQWWRDQGWSVTESECANGCCRSDVFTPPSLPVPPPLGARVCTKKRAYRTLASFREQNRHASDLE